MSYYYVPDVLKPFCNIGKYTLGAPFWVLSTFIDGVTAPLEENRFGEEVPLDVLNTGGTIPGDLGDFETLKKTLEDINKLLPKTKTSY